MYLERVALTALVALALAACGGSGGGASPVDPTPPVEPPPPAPTTSASVVTSSSAFNPAEVSLLKGGTVTWSIGAVAHNVIFGKADGAPADIATTSNTQVSRTFGTAGTFPYECTLHAGMSGTVRVQ